MTEHALPSADEIASVLDPRSWEFKNQATSIDPRNEFFMRSANSSIAKSLEKARALLALVEPAFAAQAAEVTRLREEYEALSYIAAAAMAERDKLKRELNQLRAVYAAQVEARVAAERDRDILMKRNDNHTRTRLLGG